MNESTIKIRLMQADDFDAVVGIDEKVLKAPGAVLVDFWAEWCGPCKAIAPALEEISEEMDGSITIAKVDVDSNPSTPAKYGVRGIPTLILFKDGEVSSTKVGALPKAKLAEWVRGAV